MQDPNALPEDDERPLRTNFYEKQARETSDSIMKRGPVKIVLLLVAAFACYGLYLLANWFINYDKLSAMQNVAVSVMKPRDKDGQALADVQIDNYNPAPIKNAVVSYTILGMDNNPLSQGKVTINELIPAGDTRTFTEVHLAPLTGQPRRMQAELVDIELGPKPDISPELSAKFVQSSAAKDRESVEGFEEIIAAAPNFAAAYVGLAQGQAANGQYEKAIETYKKAIALDANDANAHYGLALCYFYDQDKDNAKATIQKALSLAPNDALIKQAAKQMQQ